MRLTRQGLKMMEKAAAEGLLDKSALAVPYSNLASMHKEMGNKSERGNFPSWQPSSSERRNA